MCARTHAVAHILEDFFGLLHLLCVHTLTHCGILPEVRGKLLGVGGLHPSVQGLNSGCQLGGKCVYPLGHLASLLFLFFFLFAMLGIEPKRFFFFPSKPWSHRGNHLVSINVYQSNDC